ncbi:cellulose binding domain-containing protein [Streptomyces triculaminicus]|uniref:chitinase n=1 Tax=Streptomyces triculaminicus TaxID=2816232 RepID=A0A939FQU2_9ACTN|nr:glycoside hydrolase family 18 chitinase [Streptomyces triculaminicus]MBO0655086.1 cellulose binding domain-containing protein [Streptomyces triculaminicus]
MARAPLAALTALLLPLGLAVGLAAPAHAAPAATATFVKTSDWGTGFQAQWTVKNTGTTALDGWTVEWDFPSGTTVSSYWDALVSGSGGHVTARNREYNGSVAPGASVTFGFVGSGDGEPSGCRINGASCDGGSPSDSPPGAPGTPTAASVTADSVSLKWGAATDDKGVKNYDVYRGKAKVATVAKLAYTDTGLSAGTDYTYTVVARDTADQTGPASAPLSVRTTGGGGDPQPGTDAVKAGYFVQWGIYGRGYTVKSLDTTGAAGKLTHINYSFSNIDPVNLTCLNGVTKATSPNPQDPGQGDGAGDSWADYEKGFGAGESVDGVGDTWEQPLAGNFNQLKKLKAKYPKLKINISVGGWTYSKYFSDVAKTDASRQKFVKSCIDMYIKGDLPTTNGRGGAGVAAGVFDGFDIDWEWPGSEGHAGNHVSKDDKANNTLLFAEFRRQLDALSGTTGKKYLLTAFTPADPAKIDAGWDITTKDGTPSVLDYMDFANVQGYDFHGSGSDNSWEPNRTGHQGNLFTDPKDPYPTKFSVATTVQTYLDAGVPPRKVVLGLAFYGRGWQQVADGGANGAWQSAGGAAPGQFPEEAGTRGYDNLLASVPNLTVRHDETAVATYGYTGAGGQWWTFDDAWSIGKKTAWLKSKGLGGVMIWEMSGDHGTLMNAVVGGLG